MGWLVSIVIGLVTAACCAGAALCLASLCVNWYRISGFEGASGYWIVAMGLLGLVFGFVVGMVTARLVASGASPGYLKAQGLALAAGLGVLALIGLAARIGADVPPTIGGEELSLVLELRCPRGVTPEYKNEVDQNACSLTSLGSGSRRRNPLYGTVRWKESKEEEGVWTIPCEVFLHSGRDLLVGLKVNATNDIEILLPQPRVWGRQHLEWGEWREDRLLHEVGKPPVAGFSYRFRVRPYREWRKEEEAREAAAAQERKREIESLGAETPLAKWLEFAQADGEQGSRARAEVRNRIVEVPELLRSKNSETLRRLALAMGDIHELPGTAVEAMRQAGVVIAERVRGFDGWAENDAEREMAAQIRGAFYWWRHSIGRIEGHSWLEFREELLAIEREAAKRREDSNWQPLAESARQALEEMEASKR